MGSSIYDSTLEKSNGLLPMAWMLSGSEKRQRAGQDRIVGLVKSGWTPICRM